MEILFQHLLILMLCPRKVCSIPMLGLRLLGLGRLTHLCLPDSILGSMEHILRTLPSLVVKLDPDPLLASVYVEGTKTLAMELNDIGYETIAISANRLIGPDFLYCARIFHSEFQNDDSKVWTSVQKYSLNQEINHYFLFVNLCLLIPLGSKNDVPWIKKYANELDPQSAPPWLANYLLPNGI